MDIDQTEFVFFKVDELRSFAGLEPNGAEMIIESTGGRPSRPYTLFDALGISPKKFTPWYPKFFPMKPRSHGVSCTAYRGGTCPHGKHID